MKEDEKIMTYNRLVRPLVVKIALVASILFQGLCITSPAKADLFTYFTYQSGEFTVLDNLGASSPSDIDDSGTLLLGSASGPALLSGNTVIPISVGGAPTQAFSMSGNGTVLGRYWDAAYDDWMYFTYLNGLVTTLPNAPAETFLSRINDQGQATGVPYLYGQNSWFVYDINTQEMKTIQYPGSYWTALHAINDYGDLLVSTDVGGGQYFVYHDGTFNALALPWNSSGWGCSATDMNDNGQIIGTCMAGTRGFYRGFLLDGATFKFIDYGDPNAGSTYLSAINDSSQIVGMYYHVSDQPTLPGLEMTLVFVVIVTARRLMAA
jgi:hypothetical protein